MSAVELLLVAVLVLCITGKGFADGDEDSILERLEDKLPKPPTYPQDADDDKIVLGGLTAAQLTILSVKVVLLGAALISFIMWCYQKRRRTMYPVKI